MMPTAAPSQDTERAGIEDLYRAFDAAWQRKPGESHSFSIELCGRPVRISIVGDRLRTRLCPALEHLRLHHPPPAPDLGIDLWDEGLTGVDPPFRQLPALLPRGRLFGSALLGEDPHKGLIGYQSNGSCSVLDRSHGRLVGWVTDPDELSSFETGKPLQPLLFAWALDHDFVPIHAALVARGDRGILLGGPGGSGKSTSALSCLHAGFRYLGDDYVGLEQTAGNGFRGHSFYGTSWLEPGQLRRFPWIAADPGAGDAPPGEKQLVHLLPLAPGRLGRSARIELLVLPRVRGDGAPSTARSIRPAEAVLRLAPSSILQLPFNDSKRTLDRIAALARTVPCYSLELGTELPGISRCLDALLSGSVASP